MLKPTIRKIKDVRGRVRSYSATLGAIEVIDDDPKMASERCVASALMALNHGGAVLVMHDLHPDASGDRLVWILEYRNGSWGYRMARPMRAGSHYDGHSSCMLAVTDRRDAEIAMQRHWYQNNVEPFALAVAALGRFALAWGDA